MTTPLRQICSSRPTLLDLADDLRAARAEMQRAATRVEQIADQLIYARLREELQPAPTGIDELLTVPGAAKVLACDPATVYAYVNTQGLPVERLGHSGRIRIRRRALDQWITQRSKQ